MHQQLRHGIGCAPDALNVWMNEIMRTATTLAGRWQLNMETPAGNKMPVLILIELGAGNYTGRLEQPGRDTARVHSVRLNDDRLIFKADGKLIFSVTFNFDLVLKGDTLSGTVKVGILPATKVTGQRLKTV